LPPNDFSPVARWVAARRRAGIPTVVITYASAAVRVAAAARERGDAIDGTLFIVGGETLTSAKREAIESTGADVFTRYSIGEVGAIGHACRRMTTSDSVHVYEDSIAVIPRRRIAPLSDATVDSLLFTNLQHHAPCVLINAEMDDAGIVERNERCG